MNLLAIVKETTEKMIQDTPYKLVDIAQKKHRSGYIFTIFLDSIQGITIDACKKFSDRISDELESQDIIESYILEVSSPGIDRPLTEEWQYIKNKGRLVRVQYYENPDQVKEVTGRLQDIKNQRLYLEIQTKKNKPPVFADIAYEHLKNVKIEIEW
jgi:ribosome maturation factor RimP